MKQINNLAEIKDINEVKNSLKMNLITTGLYVKKFELHRILYFKHLNLIAKILSNLEKNEKFEAERTSLV